MIEQAKINNIILESIKSELGQSAHKYNFIIIKYRSDGGVVLPPYIRFNHIFHNITPGFDVIIRSKVINLFVLDDLMEHINAISKLLSICNASPLIAKQLEYHMITYDIQDPYTFDQIKIDIIQLMKIINAIKSYQSKYYAKHEGLLIGESKDKMINVIAEQFCQD